jgi:hypothetical protein
MPVQFNNAKFVALGEALAAANGLRLKVGMVGPKAGEKEEGSDLSLADLATIHEYGTEDGHIPERAPVRKTMIAMRDEMTVSMRKIAYGIYTGKADPRTALGLLGQKVAARIKLTITGGVQPGNAASTIARKKSSKPLVDHGQLVNAYSYVVEQEGAVAAAAAVALPAEVAA